MTPYAELAVTTNYAFLRGASHPHELVQQAHTLGLEAIGITDRNSVAGVVRAHVQAKELGQRIQTSLDALPEEYQLLLLLVADEQLSYDEIGALTSQTSDAVRGKLHRARKAFAALFHQTA